MKKTVFLSIPFVLVFLVLLGVFFISKNEQVSPIEEEKGNHSQIGLNFIRYFWEEDGELKDFSDPAWVAEEFSALGIGFQRQLVTADLTWGNIEPQDGAWNFERSDAVLKSTTVEPIVTLFAMQYASPTPPWMKRGCTFQKTVGAEARDYLETVVKRYADDVTYWEIGNEMDHWRALDEADGPADITKLPSCLPSDGFSPEEQGLFFKQTAQIIRDNDPEAIILMPGMAGLSDYTLNTWFYGVIAGGGTDWFDIVNYHFYSPWNQFSPLRKNLDAFLKNNLLTGKPVWLTETGSTSSPTLTQRTNYPNSEASQASDIFRRIVPAYALGDDVVLWHTHVSSPDEPTNDWRLYGINDDDGNPQQAYYAFKLLIDELLPFTKVEVIKEEGQRGQNIYEITREDGAVVYVAWGEGDLSVSSLEHGVSKMTDVASNNENYSWLPVRSEAVVSLSDIPILLE
ncbi:MAG: endo-1,4-beta-xylanase [Patescibacteria group bacterium]|jgi:hypothetical protein